MVLIPQLRGLVLEEVIARLLAKCGYRLLTDPAEDEALEKVGAGLAIWGRGAKHQADALGELLIPTPFSLPVRLFAEAKSYDPKHPVGLDVVRNALGVINDVNERHSQDPRTKFQPMQRFVYRYSLFSASGFTNDAQTYALAQQISLIDLSGPAFAELNGVTASTAQKILQMANSLDIEVKMDQVRAILRAALATHNGTALNQQFEQERFREARASAMQAVNAQFPHEELADIAAELEVQLEDSFVLAFPQAPFILVLRPDDMADFENFLDTAGGSAHVSIDFAGGADGEIGEWVISAADAGRRGRALARFGLPRQFDGWLLGVDSRRQARVDQVSSDFLTSLTIYRPSGPTLLLYEPTPVDAQMLDVSDDETSSPFRRARAIPELVYGVQSRNDEKLPPDPSTWFADSIPWPRNAIIALLQRLDERHPDQAAVVRATAHANGRLPRASVYQITGYGPRRSLRGFTRPIRRLTQHLVDEGLAPEYSSWPLQAWYPRAGQATWFLMPPDVAATIRSLG